MKYTKGARTNLKYELEYPMWAYTNNGFSCPYFNPNEVKIF